MFINFTARKANGDFYITSSDVFKEQNPHLDDAGIRFELMCLVGNYVAQGYDIEITQTEEA